MGLPTVLVSTADNQLQNARALDEAGAAIYAGDVKKINAQKLADTLEKLAEDEQRLQRMAEAAALVSDGAGTVRVVQNLMPAKADQGQDVVLWPVCMSDAEMILEWQRQPGIRRYSRNPAAPEPDEHYAWMRRRLDDPLCTFELVLCDGQACGFVRLDPLDKNNAYEVSILLDSTYWRQGIASVALRLLRDLVPHGDLYAYVDSDNMASVKLFTSAGYKRSGEYLINHRTQ